MFKDSGTRLSGFELDLCHLVGFPNLGKLFPHAVLRFLIGIGMSAPPHRAV